METQHIKLAAFDLDGTLLRDDKTLSQANLDALQKAADAGMILVPTTGRLYKGMPEAVRNLPFIRYVIASNGAQVYDAAEDRTLYTADIPRPDALRMLDYMETLPALRGYYQLGNAWMSAEDHAKMSQYADGILLQTMQSIYRPMENIRTALFRLHPALQKMQVYLRTEAEKQRVMAEMLQKFPDFAITTSIPINIEVNALNATKGDALQFLAEHLGFGLQNCMALGDGANDLTMLRAAGIGVAMSNGIPEAKEAADRITDTNENDGVAKALLSCL